MLCPFCHTENPEGALQCSRCHASFSSADESRQIGDAYAAAPKAAPVTARPTQVTGVLTPPNADDVTTALPLSDQLRSLRVVIRPLAAPPTVAEQWRDMTAKQRKEYIRSRLGKKLSRVFWHSIKKADGRSKLAD